MARVRRSRTIPAPREQIWKVAADPHHLPRWWPRVQRVEGVRGDGWTTVVLSRRGRAVRIDYKLLEDRPPSRRRWAQEVQGTPFESFLVEATTELTLEPAAAGEGTRVTLEARQRLRGSARLGGLMARRATGRALDEALEGLERVA